MTRLALLIALSVTFFLAWGVVVVIGWIIIRMDWDWRWD